MPTANEIERRFREVKAPHRPMGVFQDRASMDRILDADFTHEYRVPGTNAPFLVTQIH